MTAQRAARSIRLLLLLIGLVTASWLALGSAGVAHADQPATDVQPPAAPSLLAAVTGGLTAPLSTVDSLVGRLTLATPGIEVTHPVTPGGMPGTVPGSVASPTAPTIPGAAAPSTAAMPLTAATQALTTALGTAVSTTMTTATTALSTSVHAVTGEVGQTLTAATAALPAAAPVTTQLQQTLAALAGATDQIKAPADTAVRSLVAPAQESRPASSSIHPAPTSTTSEHATSPGSAPTGPSAPIALGLLLPLDAQAGAGVTQPSAALPGVRPASVHSSVATPRALDVRSLLAGGDGSLPPTPPAPTHGPSTPAPVGADGAGHAHFALGIGALPTLMPTQDSQRSTSSPLPLSPTFPPGESPD